MKKILFGFFVGMLAMVIGSTTFAAWDLKISQVSEIGHYFKWKVVCTSDGGALTATDLVPLMGGIRQKVQGQTLMLMKVSPGTGSVIPNTTIDIILSDAETDALFTETTISKDAISWHDMSADINAFIPVMGGLYLTLNDIGDAGDQVTLYFIMWRE